MLACLLLVTTLQGQVPGAVDISAIVNDRIRIGLLSDDGTMGYFFDSGVNRFPLMSTGGPVGGELLIARRENGRPHTRTTSQDSHYDYRPGAIGIDRVGTTRSLCSPVANTVLSGTMLTDGSLRLSVVHLSARSEYPNTDYEILNASGDDAQVVAARWVNARPVWFVRRWRRNAPGRIDRFEGAGEQLVTTRVGDIPQGMKQPVSFDPDSGLMVSALDGNGYFDLANAGDAHVTRIRRPGESYGRVFLSRGSVYFTNRTKVYRLNSQRDWDVFCEYEHLASSANGKFWAVRNAAGQAFLVTFGE